MKISLRTIEIFPRLGIVRPLLSGSQYLPLKQKKRIASHSCPNEVYRLEIDQLPYVKIIEITSLSETGSSRGIGNYLSKLFSEANSSSLKNVVFIAFKNHNNASMSPRYFLEKNVYYIDSECISCFTLIQNLSKSTKRITFTSYFHEKVTPNYCSGLIKAIPESNVIVYDLIPKVNLLNFSNILNMKTYFTKYRLLTATNLYAISGSTRAKLEAGGFQVKDVLKYNLIKAKTLVVQKDKSLLLFGSISPRKNVLRTIIAWDAIQREFPDYKLTLIGHYSNAAKFIIAKVLRSDTNSVCFTGEISDLEIQNLFQRTKLLVAPSTLEGLGLPLIKAIEFGTPFICADIDAYRELVTNKEAFFNPFSVKEISQKIQSAINSPDKYTTNVESVEIGTIDFSEVV
jgi:glycosyltransferase involved in cell wall biosynthesis